VNESPDENLKKKLHKLEKQLIQSEKMATLGQILAEIIHAINNPINYISTAHQNMHDHLNDLQDFLTQIVGDSAESQKLRKELSSRFEKMRLCSQDIKHGVQKVIQINEAIRNYSHAEPNPVKFIKIEKIIEESLVILSSKIKGVEIEKNLKDLPLITCHPGQIGNVFINLIGNACDAIKQEKKSPKKSNKGGAIRISGKKKKNGVSILVEDNGHGVPDEIKNLLTDTFFTTKAYGEGTGLGLSVSNEILEHHGGYLKVANSKDLGGASIEVWLPESVGR